MTGAARIRVTESLVQLFQLRARYQFALVVSLHLLAQVSPQVLARFSRPAWGGNLRQRLRHHGLRQPARLGTQHPAILAAAVAAQQPVPLRTKPASLVL